MADSQSTVAIRLGKSWRVAIVDASDAELVQRFRWMAFKSRGNRDTYYARSTTLPGQRPRRIFMHRLIMNVVDEVGIEIDHKNCDGLDNRRTNLRLATKAKNQQNRRPRKGRRFRGVEKLRGGGWRARIGINGKMIPLGSFPTEELAAAAFDAAATLQWGEFARTNFKVNHA